MTDQERTILEKCHIHYENDTLEKEIALMAIAETRKQFKEYLEEKKASLLFFGGLLGERASGYEDGYRRCLELIINELFGE